MRFKRRPQYRKILLGISILFFAFVLIHLVEVHFFWSGVIFGIGIVLFSNGFLMSRKEQNKNRLQIQPHSIVKTKQQVIK